MKKKDWEKRYEVGFNAILYREWKDSHEDKLNWVKAFSMDFIQQEIDRAVEEEEMFTRKELEYIEEAVKEKMSMRDWKDFANELKDLLRPYHREAEDYRITLKRLLNSRRQELDRAREEGRKEGMRVEKCPKCGFEYSVGWSDCPN